MTAERQPTADERAGMDWWNGLSEAARDEWMWVAGSARPADAWTAFKQSQQPRGNT